MYQTSSESSEFYGRYYDKYVGVIFFLDTLYKISVGVVGQLFYQSALMFVRTSRTSVHAVFSFFIFLGVGGRRHNSIELRLGLCVAVVSHIALSSSAGHHVLHLCCYAKRVADLAA